MVVLLKPQTGWKRLRAGVRSVCSGSFRRSNTLRAEPVTVVDILKPPQTMVVRKVYKEGAVLSSIWVLKPCVKA